MAYVKRHPMLEKKGKTSLKESTSDTRRKRMWTEADERMAAKGSSTAKEKQIAARSKTKGAPSTKNVRTGNWLKAAALEYGVTQKKIKTALEKLKTN